jgi:hypothetical protein
MKKLLLFSLLIGIAACTTSAWAASESEFPIRHMRIKPSQDPDYPYCCMREKWFFVEVDSDAQGAIYEGYSEKYENLVSLWRLKKTGHNWPVWMARIS